MMLTATMIAAVLRALAAAALALALLPAARAALFEDGEARRAILEMRQRIDDLQQSRQRTTEELRKGADENAQLRRSLLDLQTQIETLRAEQARLNGQNEQLRRDLGELQRRQKDITQGVDERRRQFEPVKVSVDGREFQADPAEKRDFEAALAIFRAGKFADAGLAFSSFVRQYPRSGFIPSARFWLGNAQYATREYQEAIVTFRQLLSHNRPPGPRPGARSRLVDRQLPNGAQRHPQRTQNAGRPAASLSAIGGCAGRQ